MKGKMSLTPYSWEQIINGVKLPEKLSSVRNDIKTGGKSKFDFVITQVVETSKAIAAITRKKYVILGGMGMYATINELRKRGLLLELMEQRISGGKNDFDIGVKPNELESIMLDFGWNEENKKLRRGRVGGGVQMVDVLGRNELPHFPWRQSEVLGQKILIQTPEEMIYEKIVALIKPYGGGDSKSFSREIKWGVDIKLLKTYLMMKNNLTQVDLEKHLSKLWI